MEWLHDEVRAAMGDGAPVTFEVLEQAHVTHVEGKDTAVLVRVPDAEPRVVYLCRDTYRVDASGDGKAVLLQLAELADHSRRDLHRMAKRLDDERNRAGIERVLRALAAGEIDRQGAQERLGLASMVDVIKLERDFGIPGQPRMISGAEDMMFDIDAMDAEDREVNRQGRVAPRQYHSVKLFREMGHDDDTVREWMNLLPGTPLPTAAEIQANTDRVVYGIEPGDVRVGLDVAVTVGPKDVKVSVDTTDGVHLGKVANRRHAGENVGKYVTEQLERMAAAGLLPPITTRW